MSIVIRSKTAQLVVSYNPHKTRSQLDENKGNYILFTSNTKKKFVINKRYSIETTYTYIRANSAKVP